MSLIDKIKKHGKKALLVLAVAGTLSGCRQGPYNSIELNDINNSKEKYVIVEGIPYEGFTKGEYILKDGSGENRIKIMRNGSCIGELQSSKFEKAMDKEIKDGDDEPVKIYGTTRGTSHKWSAKNTVNPKHAEIEGDFY